MPRKSAPEVKGAKQWCLLSKDIFPHAPVRALLISRQSRKHHCRPEVMAVNALAQLHQSKILPKMWVQGLDVQQEGRSTSPTGTKAQELRKTELSRACDCKGKVKVTVKLPQDTTSSWRKAQVLLAQEGPEGCEVMTRFSIFHPEGLEGGQENTHLVSFTFSPTKVME